MSSTKKVTFAWDNIVRRFSESFEIVFSANKKVRRFHAHWVPNHFQAHFDCLPQAYKVIDGARSRWSNLLLLDAVIYYMTAKDFIFISRRAFNQQRALFAAVFDELQAMDRTLHANLLDGGSASRHVDVCVAALAYPWTDIETLKFYLLQDPPAKSKQRFLSIIDLLCNTSPLSDSVLQSLFADVVSRVLGEVECYQMQMSLGSCPKSSYKIESYKSTSFYQRCSALAKTMKGKALVARKVSPRAAASRRTARTTRVFGRLEWVDSDSEEGEEAQEEDGDVDSSDDGRYARKRRHTEDYSSSSSGGDGVWASRTSASQDSSSALSAPFALSYQINGCEAGLFTCDDETTRLDDGRDDDEEEGLMLFDRIFPSDGFDCDAFFTSSAVCDSRVSPLNADMEICLQALLRSDSLDSMTLFGAPEADDELVAGAAGHVSD